MGISSDYSALARTNFQGMVSGLETDTLVDAMMLNAQSKIDKANQKYELYGYKQDAYRDVISSIDSFSSKYTSYSSSISLVSNTFFNQMTSTSNSTNFTVSGTSSAVAGDMTMSIEQLATTTTLSGSSISSVENITGTLDPDFLKNVNNYEVSFTFSTGGGENEIFTLDQDNIDKIFNGDEVTYKLANDEVVTFTTEGGKLVIQHNESVLSSVMAEETEDTETGSLTTSLGLEKLGLTAGQQGGSYEVANDDGDLEIVYGFNTTTKKDAQAGIDVVLDGVSKTIKFDDFVKFSGDDIDMAATLASLETELESLFGTGNINFEYDANAGTFEISAKEGRQITIGGSSDLLTGLGLETGSTNVLYGGNTVTDVFAETLFNKKDEEGLEYGTITINGVDIDIYATDTISQMVSKVNNSDAGVTMALDSFTSTFSISSNESGLGFEMDFSTSDNNGNLLLASVMGVKDGYNMDDVMNGVTESVLVYDEYGNVVQDENGDVYEDVAVDLYASYSSGVNAEFTLNGVSTERGSNVFTVNGVTFELNEVHETGESDTISTSRDVDSVMEGITSFIDDYNALIEELNGLIDEKYDSDYPPLTDAQKEEMSESEIANWEAKAKTGVLANDDIISDYLTAMRTTMYSQFGENGTALWQIGIEASDDWTENGKLYIDEDKLRQTLMEDPDVVRDLFAGTDGLVTAVSNVCKTYANTSSGSPGLLVEKAGVAGTATEYNNTLYNWMQTTLSQLEKLETNYTLQYDRYWAAFTNMETVLSQLSSQSSWLSQQFAY